MISRSAVSRAGQLALRRQQTGALAAQSRGFAATASASASAAFEKSDVAGITVVSKDAHGPATRLAIVAKAGTRYQPAPGLTAGLEGFAFKNTLKRSALRITRESELLGGQLNAYHTREAIVLEASFLREHLPYFAELLGEVASQTKFTKHELDEDIEPVLHLKQAKYTVDALARALDGAHNVAFHSGLGEAFYPTTTTPVHNYVGEHGVAAFAAAAYTRPNLAVVADGATQVALAKWVEPFFKSLPATATGPVSLPSSASTYYGGQQRTESAYGNAVVIAFPTSGLDAADPVATVLASLLGGESAIKWSAGFSLLAKTAAAHPAAKVVASNLVYSDAGLLTLQVSGAAEAVRSAAAAAVDTLKSVADAGVAKEDLAKAIAKAKFDALLSLEPGVPGTIAAAGTAVLSGAAPLDPAAASKAYESVTADKVKTLAKKLLAGKASFAAVGDLHVLPYAEDIGLKA